MSEAKPKNRQHLRPVKTDRPPKRARISALYRSGVTDLSILAAQTGARPSYVAQVLEKEGLLAGYHDLYTHTGKELNVYSRYFKNVVSFKDVESARSSVARIAELYRHFEQLRDRAGQHHAMMTALIGLNRARWSGKLLEAAVYRDWLEEVSRLDEESGEARKTA